jgi:DNA/RNA endonuclease YhcR with UshA esterase domain
MKHISTLMILAMVALSSCKTQHSITTKTSDINGAGVIQKPVIVDMEVKEEKVFGTSNGKGKQITDDLKNQAIADAVKKSNADVLIEPRFETDIKGRRITVTVTGFPANYKNFRPIKQEDVELLKASKVQQVETSRALHVKSKGGRVVLALGIGAALFVSILLAIL